MTDYTNPVLQTAHDEAAGIVPPLNVPDWLLEAAEACIEDQPQDANAVELALRVMAFVRCMSEEWRRVDTMIPPYQMTTETIDRAKAHELMADPDERVLLRFVTNQKWVKA